MLHRSAPFRDIILYDDSIPFNWDVPLTRNGVVEDLTSSTILAKLTDDGLEIGDLPVDSTKLPQGIVSLTLTQDLYDQIKTYSTWRIKETGIYNGHVARGRLIKRSA